MSEYLINNLKTGNYPDVIDNPLKPDLDMGDNEISKYLAGYANAERKKLMAEAEMFQIQRILSRDVRYRKYAREA
tara:strand:+ start:792 stop:1016 length:225 start_codon:yes stop_codon:yes gene_type:complete